jgi:hypothetical protein
MMAGDQGALTRYLQALGRSPRLLRRCGSGNTADQQLHYQAAQLSVPLVQGRWVLVQLEPTKDRKDVASLEYVYLKPDGRRLRVRMRLGYDDGLKDMDAAAKQKSLQEAWHFCQRADARASGSGCRPCRSATLCKASRPAARKEKSEARHPASGLGLWCAELETEPARRAMIQRARQRAAATAPAVAGHAMAQSARARRRSYRARSAR